MSKNDHLSQKLLVLKKKFEQSGLRLTIDSQIKTIGIIGGVRNPSNQQEQENQGKPSNNNLANF
jgi:hypothetical protein